ncbi:MAG: hypothetical protein ACHQUC_02075 [Chlamydiales bacterium]
MVSSNVTRYIGQCQDYCSQALGPVKTIAAKPFNWVSEKWTDAIQSKGFKPTYERYIQPLNRTDAFLISGCGIVAIGIIWIAYKIFGKSLIAASVMLSLTLCVGCWKLTRYRAEMKFKEEAHQILSDMIRIVQSTTRANLHLTEITEERGKLKHVKFEFESLTEELKNLDKQISDFRRDALDRSKASKFDDFKGALTTHLQKIVDKLPSPSP